MQRFESMARGRASVTMSLLLALALLAGCAFGGGAPAAETVQLPAYAPQPPATTPSQVAPPAAASGSETTGSETTSHEAAGDASAAPMALAEEAASTAFVSTSTTGAVYGAEIVADHQVVVAAQVGGQVMSVAMEVGDEVRAGQVLVKLDSSVLEAQAAQARAALDAAASNLAALQDPANAQDVAAAQAAISAASASYTRASGGPTDEERRLALAQLMQAQAAVTVAQAAYNVVKNNPDIGMRPQSLQLQQATLAQEAAQAQYDKIMKGATADQIAAAYAQLQSARAQLQRLQDGAKPAQVDAAAAQVDAAQYAYYLAQLQVSRATIKAPVDGIVSKVQTAAGSLAAPGAPVATLLSQTVRINVAVEESRLSQLAVGQPALIRAAAYPGRTFNGVVAIIAPELDPATRTVQVTIRPDDAEALLAPGMSATVELLAR